jgi:hypothetical protein
MRSNISLILLKVQENFRWLIGADTGIVNEMGRHLISLNTEKEVLVSIQYFGTARL